MIEVFLDSNVIVDAYLEEDYFELLKKLKEKYKLEYFITIFAFYESFFVILKHKIAEKLIVEKKIKIDKIVKCWFRPFEFFEELPKEELENLSKEVSEKLYGLFKELGIEIFPPIEDLGETLADLILDALKFAELGIHLEDALNLILAKGRGFITKDSNLYKEKIRKRLFDLFKIRIINGNKDQIEKEIEELSKELGFML